jgi:hypothetical protein
LRSRHVCEGFIKQNIFATKTPRHEVNLKQLFFLCALVPLWLFFPVYPGWENSDEQVESDQSDGYKFSDR